MGKFSHSSDRTHINEHNGTHGYDGGKPPLPKHGGGTTTIHGGMSRVVDGKPIIGSGHDASYLDSLTGATVPGSVKSAPGWGNATVRSGNPTVHAPASKRLRPVPVHPNMSKGADHDQMLHDLGASILNEAVKCK
jgi:hypothetical protein